MAALPPAVARRCASEEVVAALDGDPSAMLMCAAPAKMAENRLHRRSQLRFEHVAAALLDANRVARAIGPLPQLGTARFTLGWRRGRFPGGIAVFLRLLRLSRRLAALVGAFVVDVEVPPPRAPPRTHWRGPTPPQLTAEPRSPREASDGSLFEAVQPVRVAPLPLFLGDISTLLVRPRQWSSAVSGRPPRRWRSQARSSQAPGEGRADEPPECCICLDRAVAVRTHCGHDCASLPGLPLPGPRRPPPQSAPSATVPSPPRRGPTVMRAAAAMATATAPTAAAGPLCRRSLCGEGGPDGAEWVLAAGDDDDVPSDPAAAEERRAAARTDLAALLGGLPT